MRIPAVLDPYPPDGKYGLSFRTNEEDLNYSFNLGEPKDSSSLSISHCKVQMSISRKSDEEGVVKNLTDMSVPTPSFLNDFLTLHSNTMILCQGKMKKSIEVWYLMGYP